MFGIAKREVQNHCTMLVLVIEKLFFTWARRSTEVAFCSNEWEGGERNLSAPLLKKNNKKIIIKKGITIFAHGSVFEDSAENQGTSQEGENKRRVKSALVIFAEWMMDFFFVVYTKIAQWN